MRTVSKLTAGWVFHADFSSALVAHSQPGEAVRLPHNALDLPMNYFDETSFQKELGYQYTLAWQPGFAGKEVALVFDGAMANSVVWLNGQRVAGHKDGYTPFEARLTDYLREGDNLVTVKVDGTENPEIPPFGGQIDYLTYAGIYRDVWLKVTDPVSIANLKIETSEVLSDAKTVTVAASLANPRGLPVSGSLQADLLDSDGTLLHSTRVALSGDSALVRFDDLAGLQLWQLDSPVLYSVRLSLQTPHGLDSLSARFGFRTAEFAVDGFRLNGQPLKIRGLNRHQSFPYVGYAMGRRAQQQDADLLKHTLKCNLVRTSHYPQSTYFLDRCDEIGLLVFEEIPGWQHIGGPAWQDESVENVRRMVQRDWNHPSIIIWGVRINESRDDHDFFSRTNAAARQLDSTRQIGGVRCIPHSELIEDVYTMNDFAHVAGPEFMAGLAPTPLRKPRDVTGLDHDVPYLVTEFNGHMFPTKRIDPEVRQSEHVGRYLDVLNQAYGNPLIAGCIGWCMFDYNTHQDFGAGDRVCYHGVMDIFREPKFAASVYTSQCPPQEQVVLEPVSYWARGEKDRCEALPMTVLTNCDYLEFQVGSLRTIRVEPDRERYPHLPHPPVTIDSRSVPMAELGEWGMAWKDARVTGYVGGKAVAQVLLSGNPLPTTLQVQADSTELLVDEKDTVRVIVRALDQQGRVLPFLDDVVTLQVDGGAKLLGPSVLAFKGGVVGFWVESTGERADTRIRIGTQRLGEQTLVLRAV